MRDHVIVRECPECAPDAGRRQFLKTAGVAVVAAAGFGRMQPAFAVDPLPRGTQVPPAETTVGRLYRSLTAEQRALVTFPFNDPRSTHVSANWHVAARRIGEVFTEEQKRMIHEILRGVTSEEGYERFIRQMLDDDNGFDRYSCAIFGTPESGKFQWVMTGRHLTIRADGNSMEGVAFGGPMIYGHGETGNLKTNLFYYQTKAANEVFQALDGRQREKALLDQAPAENAIQLKPGQFAGIAVGELSRDQRALVEKVMATLLAPYREADVKEAMEAVKANGGIEQIHLSFYRSGDLGNDQEWDIWRLEGPTLVWHFRGAPHVHTWVNFRTRPVG